MDSPQSHPRVLIKARTTAVICAAVTAYVLALAIRHLLHPPHPDSGSLVNSDFLPNWLSLTLSLVFYAVFCWMALTWIPAALGRERLFMVGWFAAILLSPRGLGPRWSITITCIDVLGLTIALFAAISFVPVSSNTAEST